MGEFINPADVPKVKFYTGDEAPCIGMGTFGSDRFTADQIAEAVDGAIKSGYRMFDCAACYGNEPEIGKVFKNAFDEGIVERKDLFVMTKVWKISGVIMWICIIFTGHSRITMHQNAM